MSLLKNVPAALKYVRYRMSSSNAHGLHSPFVFDLYNNVIRDQTPFYIFNVIEAIRSQMLLSNKQVEVHDFGTGGKKVPVKNLTLKYIAGHYVKPARYAQLFFRMVNKLRPVHILELGTSLGITTMYLAAANSRATVYTLEGCPNTAAIAGQNFKKSGIKNIRQETGEFNSTLPKTLSTLPRLDFVYFDGNHRKDPTLQYFQQCVQRIDEQSVFVFDDIHWNADMSEAWKVIQQHESVTLTIDLFSCGIVFFSKELAKQDFVLRF